MSWEPIGIDGVSGDKSLSTALSTEVSNRVSGDSSLSTAISTEVSNRVSGDASLSTALSTEVSSRILRNLSSGISILSSVGPGYLQILQNATAVSIGQIGIGNLDNNALVFIAANLSVTVDHSAVFFSAN